MKEAGCDEELEDHIERLRAELRAAVRQIDEKVRIAIGKALTTKGVSPIELYTRAVDTREVKAAKLQAGGIQASRNLQLGTVRVTTTRAVAA